MASWIHLLMLGTGLLGAGGRAAAPGLSFQGGPARGAQQPVLTPAKPKRLPGFPWGVDSECRQGREGTPSLPHGCVSCG